MPSVQTFVSFVVKPPPRQIRPVNQMESNNEPKPNLRTELVAGLTTFFTMAYIVVVNPAILSTEGTGMPFSGVLTATVVICFTMTLLMGVYARLPFAVAPGMGLNAFFAFTVIIGRRVPWPVALGAVFWAGVLFLAVSLTPVREAIARAIPRHLRMATAAGIGVFLTFIGLKNAGVVAAHPETFVTLGKLDYRALLMLLGLAVTVLLSLSVPAFGQEQTGSIEVTLKDPQGGAVAGM